MYNLKWISNVTNIQYSAALTAVYTCNLTANYGFSLQTLPSFGDIHKKYNAFELPHRMVHIPLEI